MTNKEWLYLIFEQKGCIYVLSLHVSANISKPEDNGIVMSSGTNRCVKNGICFIDVGCLLKHFNACPINFGILLRYPHTLYLTVENSNSVQIELHHCIKHICETAAINSPKITLHYFQLVFMSFFENAKMKPLLTFAAGELNAANECLLTSACVNAT